MSETTIQALLLILKQIVLAAIGILIASAGQLLGLVPDDSTRLLLGFVLVPLLNGLTRLISGPVEQVQKTVGRGVASGTIRRPNFLNL